MPPIRRNIGRRTHNARRLSNRSEEQRERFNIASRDRNARSRSARSEEEREERNRSERLRMQRSAVVRNRSNDRSERYNLNVRVRRQTRVRNNLERVAFEYDPAVDYGSHTSIVIGTMNKICQYCGAKKFKTEAVGLCCANGKVKLPVLQAPPEPLIALMSGATAQSKHFLANIQPYNSCFQMTSFGATNIIHNDFMPTFKIQGQIYHRIGALLPLPNINQQFLQIYFIGNSNVELDRRCAIQSNVRREIVEQLQILLHQENELVRVFETALDRMPSDNHKVVIHADKVPHGQHPGRFNAPTIDDVSIVMVGEEFPSRDIVLHCRNNQLQRVCETHRSYDALQYPILFCRGEDGYEFSLRLINPQTGESIPNKKVSAMNYYSYRLMLRENEYNHIVNCRRLFHQFAVDMYAKIETERLNFIRFNQQKLRSEEYIHLRDAINNDVNMNDIGRLIILPSTYTGSPRHMHEYAQDAMTYVRHYGRPDLFLTFTCNPKWDEIKEHLFNGQIPSERHDITARVFKQKLKAFVDFIVKLKVFGEVRCWMISVEWQKRGLPHAHMLVWLVNKITPNEIDSVISAEIPDQAIDPELYEVVIKNMIYGPCGDINRNSSCMVDGKCSKRYPMSLVTETVSGNDGYPLYRRRSTDDNGRSTVIKFQNHDLEVDNRWIVPYSPLLLKTFKAHINVEYCNSVKSIKYICKYVNKGNDMAVFGVVNENRNDEILQYQMGRYISSNEAIWRIFSFPIHERYPTVMHLAIHLENGQRVYFTDQNAAQRAANPPSTTLTAFFKLCQNDVFAKTLLYAEVPSYFTWNASNKEFQRRKQGTPVHGFANVFFTSALGRIYTVHPNNAECFYLRMLLINIRGPTSFQDLRTVNGNLCVTYREACQRLHLLECDAHWDNALNDASLTSSPHQIRTLFSILISTCNPSNPIELWRKYRDCMSEDILRRMRLMTLNQDLQFTDEIYNEVLVLIEDMCFSMANKTLEQLGMASPNRPMHGLLNQEVERERNFDTNELATFLHANIQKLNAEQKRAYDTIMHAVDNALGGFYFLDAPGGTGKTFLISLVLAALRSQNKIVLALASSGIAATLLDGGRTAHSALKLPLNVQLIDHPTCNISKTSGMAKVLQQCTLIVWDECTMAHKKSLEALQRTLQDLRQNQNLFGGVLVLLAGDFRQTLPVIAKSTAADQLNASLKSSNLWRFVKTLKLETNIRVQLQREPTAALFSKQLLAIGDGKIPADNMGLITLPQSFCQFAETKEQLVAKVFPNLREQYKNHAWLSERAILAGKNKDVNEMNANIQSQIIGDLVSYKSVDTVIHQEDVVNYPTEFLNSLDVPGLPVHNLELKIGVPVIMLRNINQPKLCNGTRLAVKRLMNNIIEATILTGKYKGEDVLIPRIPMIPTDMPFEFKRLQFPVRLAFAITINKAQGQSFQVCGLDLEYPVFSHGQLYVGCSRVGKPSALFIFCQDGKTKNVVYQRALQTFVLNNCCCCYNMTAYPYFILFSQAIF